MADSRFEPLQQFRMGLADALKKDVLRFHSSGKRASQLAAGDYIRPKALVCQDLQGGKVWVGLHREREVRVARE